MFHREGLVPVWMLLSPRCSEEGPTPRTPPPPLLSGPGVRRGGPPSSLGFRSPLSSRTPWQPGVACVCTRACVSLASGNREKGREKQMGPPRLPLACKLKGGENHNKTRKQLWWDSSSVWGGSRPQGACRLSRFCSEEAGGYPPKQRPRPGGAPSLGHQVHPPHPPSRTVQWRWDVSLTTGEKICTREPSLRLMVRCVL